MLANDSFITVILGWLRSRLVERSVTVVGTRNHKMPVERGFSTLASTYFHP